MRNNKTIKHLVPWTFRRVYSVWGFLTALRFLWMEHAAPLFTRTRLGTAIHDFRDEIEERYKENPTGGGNSFGEILCYEIHHGSDGEHEGGLTFNWLAKKWGISVSFLGELISDHCKKL